MRRLLIISLLAFLVIAFSSNKAFSQIEFCYDWEVEGWAYSELLHNDAALLVSGLAGTEILVYDYTPSFCDHDFDAWVYSELANSSTVLSFGRLQSSGWQVDGQHGTFNAQYRTYCVTSAHGFVDSWSYITPETIQFFTDEYTGTFTQDCHTFTPPPSPTPCNPLAGLPCPTPTPAPNVISVTYSQVNTSTEGITPNPAVAPHNPGIGQRIFPDDDVPMDPDDRRRVLVTAAISPAIPNVPVYFRNFDLDDPATDTTIDPMGTAGNDNNGMPMAGMLSAASTMTNASGVATVEFIVTRQPGDNFAIAASTSQTQANVNVAGIELTNASGGIVQINCTATDLVCRSQMLTVWRRLHIEVDSMGPALQNLAQGRIATTTRIRVGETRVVPLTANDGTSPNLELNRFEGGRLFWNNRSLSVTCNLAMGDTCNTANSVTVTNNGGSLVTLVASTPFQLYDDDDFNNDDGTNVDGDGLPSPGENIDPPDTGFMTANSADPTADINNPAGNIYAQAYIHPVYDIGDNNTNTLFSANVNAATGNNIRALFDFDQIATEASTEFWTAYLLGGYQYILSEDEDPSTEVGIVGVTDVQNGVGSIVFMETNGPAECTVSPDFCSIADTSAHEIGHLLNADEGDGGIMDGIGHNFSPTSLRKIRVITHP